MMARKPAGKEFQVSYDITLKVSEPVVATSLEEALAVGRKRQPHDVVDIDGLEYIEGEIEVTGVY